MQTCADLFASSFSSIPRALRQLWFGDDVYEAKRSILEFVFMPSGGVAALMEPVMARQPCNCAKPLACAHRLHSRHATPLYNFTTRASSAGTRTRCTVQTGLLLSGQARPCTHGCAGVNAERRTVHRSAHPHRDEAHEPGANGDAEGRKCVP